MRNAINAYMDLLAIHVATAGIIPKIRMTRHNPTKSPARHSSRTFHIDRLLVDSIFFENVIPGDSL